MSSSIQSAPAATSKTEGSLVEGIGFDGMDVFPEFDRAGLQQKGLESVFYDIDEEEPSSAEVVVESQTGVVTQSYTLAAMELVSDALRFSAGLVFASNDTTLDLTSASKLERVMQNVLQLALNRESADQIVEEILTAALNLSGKGERFAEVVATRRKFGGTILAGVLPRLLADRDIAQDEVAKRPNQFYSVREMEDIQGAFAARFRQDFVAAPSCRDGAGRAVLLDFEQAVALSLRNGSTEQVVSVLRPAPFL